MSFYKFLDKADINTEQFQINLFTKILWNLEHNTILCVLILIIFCLLMLLFILSYDNERQLRRYCKDLEKKWEREEKDV